MSNAQPWTLAEWQAAMKAGQAVDLGQLAFTMGWQMAAQGQQPGEGAPVELLEGHAAGLSALNGALLRRRQGQPTVTATREQLLYCVVELEEMLSEQTLSDGDREEIDKVLARAGLDSL